MIDKEFSPYQTTGKVNFTVIFKTALLCWQKSFRRYISKVSTNLNVPFYSFVWCRQNATVNFKAALTKVNDN